MKPRLDSAPMTELDSRIWNRVTVQFHAPGVVAWEYLWIQAGKSDERDADLMYVLAMVTWVRLGKPRRNNFATVHALTRVRQEYVSEDYVITLADFYRDDIR